MLLNTYQTNLVRAVMLGMVTAGLDVMMFGVAGVPVGAVGMMRGLFVIAGVMMLGGFAMMLRGVLVVFGGLVMMFYAFVVAHISLPVRQCEKTRDRFTQLT
jgi:hypothetical protein